LCKQSEYGNARCGQVAAPGILVSASRYPVSKLLPDWPKGMFAVFFSCLFLAITMLPVSACYLRYEHVDALGQRHLFHIVRKALLSLAWHPFFPSFVIIHLTIVVKMTHKQSHESPRSGSVFNLDTDFSKFKKNQPGRLLQVFFIDQLKDIYWAENYLLKALPKMRAAATTPELQTAFEEHLAVTKEQIIRLEQVFELVGKKAEGKKCDAMHGLVMECEAIIEDTKEDTLTRDVALIIAAQKVEHYEIATYGGLTQLALTMGWDEVADLLETTLQEEKQTDWHLTSIAEKHINWEAAHEDAAVGR